MIFKLDADSQYSTYKVCLANNNGDITVCTDELANFLSKEVKYLKVAKNKNENVRFAKTVNDIEKQMYEFVKLSETNEKYYDKAAICAAILSKIIGKSEKYDLIIKKQKQYAINQDNKSIVSARVRLIIEKLMSSKEINEIYMDNIKKLINEVEERYQYIGSVEIDLFERLTMKIAKQYSDSLKTKISAIKSCEKLDRFLEINYERQAFVAVCPYLSEDVKFNAGDMENQIAKIIYDMLLVFEQSNDNKMKLIYSNSYFVDDIFVKNALYLSYLIENAANFDFLQKSDIMDDLFNKKIRVFNIANFYDKFNNFMKEHDSSVNFSNLQNLFDSEKYASFDTNFYNYISMFVEKKKSEMFVRFENEINSYTYNKNYIEAISLCRSELGQSPSDKIREFINGILLETKQNAIDYYLSSFQYAMDEMKWFDALDCIVYLKKLDAFDDYDYALKQFKTQIFYSSELYAEFYNNPKLSFLKYYGTLINIYGYIVKIETIGSQSFVYVNGAGNDSNHSFVFTVDNEIVSGKGLTNLSQVIVLSELDQIFNNNIMIKCNSLHVRN